eukprot:tig00000654_g2820.t1
MHSLYSALKSCDDVADVSELVIAGADTFLGSSWWLAENANGTDTSQFADSVMRMFKTFASLSVQCGTCGANPSVSSGLRVAVFTGQVCHSQEGQGDFDVGGSGKETAGLVVPSALQKLSSSLNGTEGTQLTVYVYPRGPYPEATAGPINGTNTYVK